jgi:hypothetical protein
MTNIFKKAVVSYLQTLRSWRICELDFGISQIVNSSKFFRDLAAEAKFSQGNLASAFEAFPIAHKCNKFCKLFRLDAPEPFETLIEETGAME